MLKVWGVYVASICLFDVVDFVVGFGVDLVVDYSIVNVKEELKIFGG